MTSLSHFEATAATDRGAVVITGIEAMRLEDGFCLIRVDTDAGISGYGECGDNDGDLVRAIIDVHAAGGGRLPHLKLIGKDPLAIGVHHHNMFYAFPQRRPHMQVLSGIDMALWDLAGKLLGKSVATLLGGPFRDDLLLYSHCPQGDFTDAGAWRERAAVEIDDLCGTHARVGGDDDIGDARAVEQHGGTVNETGVAEHACVDQCGEHQTVSVTLRRCGGTSGFRPRRSDSVLAAR